MWRLLETIPLGLLAAAAAVMLAAPLRPRPHVIEKLAMLAAGRLTRPLDIFDLLYHLAPTALLALKLYARRRR